MIRFPRSAVHFVDGALVLRHVFPPLGVLVVVAHERTVFGLPLVRLCDIPLGRGDADAQRCIHGLIACAGSANIGHVVATFIGSDVITAAPFVVDECWETAPLVLVPEVGTVGGIGQQAPLGLPVQQVVARRQPCLVAAPVGAVLAVIYHVGHQPPSVFAEHGGTVYLMVVVCWSHHHSVFIGCAHLLVDAPHLLFADVLCRDGEADENK